MRGWKARFAWTFSIALGSVLAFWLHAALAPRAHLADGDCDTCHLAGAGTTMENAGRLTGSENALCGRCHAKALRLSHPAEVTPSMTVPATFPLDWKGDLVCSSCHDVHALHGETPALIRGGRLGRELCLECHQQAFFERMPDGGASLTARGHLDAREDSPPLPLDVYSLQCMECHNDKSDELPVDVDSGGILRHADNAMNHPIGRSYEAAMRYGGYRPRALLREDIQLPGGRLSCVSCHRGYSGEHGKLIMSNQGSALCLECHDL